MTRQHRLATLAVQAGEDHRGQFHPLSTPIVQTSTFIFPTSLDVQRYSEGKSSAYMYTRYGNPTLHAAEVKIAALEGGEEGLVTASGMAAISTAALTVLHTGDEIVSSRNIYGGTFHFFNKVLSKFNIGTHYFDGDDLEAAERLITPRTRLLYLETPANPTMRIIDLRRAVQIAKKHRLFSMVDSTFGTPVLQRPLKLGFDLVMHSVTKYLSGHSDIIGGALVGSHKVISEIRDTMKRLGGIMDPTAAYFLLRGLKTLTVRVERQCETASRLARFLARHSRIERAHYPGLKSSPYHRLAVKQMGGLFGGMVAADLRGGRRAAMRFADRLRVFQNAASLGGVESLISLPVLTSQWGYTPQQLRDVGITEGTVRLSVGVEDARDLIEDIRQALE
ncbi:MAG: aminotransferase class I/II-fold pyridoxal phosphate-dependent enzyme [Acidobacteriia bacterium]|nr:aminotransferase class I/II-fold pyridoxal phosphate-dependent enzyme [Terriglobia bacterium]